MATVISVHGTFAKPSDGTVKHWWESGSLFEVDLRNLVEPEDGELRFLSHSWNGLNSERARRGAGDTLAKRLQELDAKSEKYCIISHSHGGSVALTALAQCIHRKHALKGLSHCVTVGTPFISFANLKIVISQLGLFGKAAYILAMTTAVLFFIADSREPNSMMSYLGNQGWQYYLVPPVISIFLVDRAFATWIASRRSQLLVLLKEPSKNRIFPNLGAIGSMFYFLVLGSVTASLTFSLTSESLSADERLAGTIAVAVAFLVFDLCVRGIVTLMQRKRGTSAKKFVEWYASKWTALNHAQDEAIEGLRQLPEARFKIFYASFFANALAVLGVLLFPASIIVALYSDSVMSWITSQTGLPTSTAAQRFTALWQSPALMINKSIDVARFETLVEEAALFAAPFLIVTVIFVLCAKVFAISASWIISLVLNRVTWSQIRASAYGSDVIGETWRSAESMPTGALRRNSLPQELATEITAAADQCALASIGKLRLSLNRLAFNEGDAHQSDVVGRYLTWDELIHTTYFKISGFRKLVAYAITQSEGFRPTSAFLADPDYGRVAKWFSQVAAPAALRVGEHLR